jgi:hypothetical protein
MYNIGAFPEGLTPRDFIDGKGRSKNEIRKDCATALDEPAEKGYHFRAGVRKDGHWEIVADGKSEQTRGYELIERQRVIKTPSPETEEMPKIAAINTYIEETLPQLKAQVGALPQSTPRDYSDLNCLFLRAVEGSDDA